MEHWKQKFSAMDANNLKNGIVSSDEDEAPCIMKMNSRVDHTKARRKFNRVSQVSSSLSHNISNILSNDAKKQIQKKPCEIRRLSQNDDIKDGGHQFVSSTPMYGKRHSIIFHDPSPSPILHPLTEPHRKQQFSVRNNISENHKKGKERLAREQNVQEMNIEIDETTDLSPNEMELAPVSVRRLKNMSNEISNTMSENNVPAKAASSGGGEIIVKQTNTEKHRTVTNKFESPRSMSAIEITHNPEKGFDVCQGLVASTPITEKGKPENTFEISSSSSSIIQTSQQLSNKQSVQTSSYDKDVVNQNRKKVVQMEHWKQKFSAINTNNLKNSIASSDEDEAPCLMKMNSRVDHTKARGKAKSPPKGLNKSELTSSSDEIFETGTIRDANWIISVPGKQHIYMETNNCQEDILAIEKMMDELKAEPDPPFQNARPSKRRLKSKTSKDNVGCKSRKSTVTSSSHNDENLRAPRRKMKKYISEGCQENIMNNKMVVYAEVHAEDEFNVLELPTKTDENHFHGAAVKENDQIQCFSNKRTNEKRCRNVKKRNLKKISKPGPRVSSTPKKHSTYNDVSEEGTAEKENDLTHCFSNEVTNEKDSRNIDKRKVKKISERGPVVLSTLEKPSSSDAVSEEEFQNFQHTGGEKSYLSPDGHGEANNEIQMYKTRQKRKTVKSGSKIVSSQLIKLPDNPTVQRRSISENTSNELRRSKRNRIKPLQFWRGEKIKYEIGADRCFQMMGVNPGFPEVKQWRSSKASPPHQRQISSLSNIVTAPLTSRHLVKLPHGNRDYELECFSTLRCDSDQTEIEDNIIAYTGLEVPGMSTGCISIKPSAEAVPSVDDRNLVCYVLKGSLIVIIHNTKKELQKGDFFFVPQGVHYEVKNFSKRKAVLIYTKYEN